MSDAEQLLSTLFEPGELVCSSPSPFGTEVKRIADPTDLFFSINPLHTDRRDSNVTCFRNVLIELDQMPLELQNNYVNQRLPTTTMVFSGKKSFHFIISLATPCLDEISYRALVDRIYAAVPGCDLSCKNPSRFSRLPGRLRPDTGVTQKLYRLGPRINNDYLESFLPPPIVAPANNDAEPWTDTDLLMLLNKAVLEPDKMMSVVGSSGRNAFFFWLGQRMADAKWSMDKRRDKIESTYKRLGDKSKFSLREAKHAARVRG